MDIYTDGSHYPNQESVGWALVVVSDGIVVDALSGYRVIKTNKRSFYAELYAIWQAAIYIRELNSNDSCTIYSDLLPAIDEINKDSELSEFWMIPKRCLKSLYQQIYEINSNHRVKTVYKYIKAHSGNVYNDLADIMAKRQAKYKIEGDEW